MGLVIQGIILGFIIVLPGMSGGTVFLIFGLYEKMVKDLLRLHIRPYLPLAGGILIGIFGGGFTFAFFFENHRDPTAAFLLGCLLASIKAVLRGCPKVNQKGFITMVLGVLIGLLMVVEPLGHSIETENVNWWLLMLGGAFSSAAMIIPGIPGSSVLILLGLYDTMLFSIKELQLSNLLFFGAGSVLGIFLLLNLLGKLYEKYRAMVSFFFAGLILGSSRAIMPSTPNPLVVFLFTAGFLLVWIWSGKESSNVLRSED
ncbi:undecaprenyl phosphate translocase family protein [Geosporobacter ferrireducens]|uniref:DUF368 domain-containing protein n=1 Tax=Geosporobacter ferrireducens TaxID=1424294 RepID=A0A1D8GGE5_9FIRM|nr:DUF368 domain-containing protein [Geosporobacter ferrireducens]AOT69975.1 DUF368 domain-containing protein [Geosporobacter ferrireducens]MTI58347.1 DUF368 domain-containing protein [Geosporobacter ferrireducens]